MGSTIAPRYSLTELADVAGVTPRTVRYYISQGLLPSPGTSGPGAKYDDAHLDRLRLIRRLQREHLPLADIRQRLEGLDAETITSLAVAEPPKVSEESALDYVRALLAPPAAPPAAPPIAHRSLLKRASSAIPGITGPKPTPRPPQIERSQWERISLAPNVELHVRRPLPRPIAKQVDRIVSIARDLLEEEPS